MGMDQDDWYLPLYNSNEANYGTNLLGGIVCSAITEEASQPAQDQITEILRRNHN